MHVATLLCTTINGDEANVLYSHNIAHAVLVNTHTYPIKGNWKFSGGVGVKRPTYLKDSINLK